MGSVVQLWAGERLPPGEIWSSIWAWADRNGSPLAVYHACQSCIRLLGRWELLPRSEFTNRILSVVNGTRTDDRWSLRCTLARHFCEHLESLASGWIGEIVAAYAWWFAEYVADIIDSFDASMQKEARRILDQESKVSNELWTIGRSTVVASPLRYATLFVESLWSTSLLCELADEQGQSGFDLDPGLVEALVPICHRLSVQGLRYPAAREAKSYAFEGDTGGLAAASTLTASLAAASLASLELLREIDDADKFQAALVDLPNRDVSAQRQVAHELRLRAFVGRYGMQDIRNLLADTDWRRRILVEGHSDVIELILNAAIQLQVLERDQGIKVEVTHLFALAADDAPVFGEQKKLLFAYVIVSSLAVNSVSAVERLVSGQHLGEYREFALKWRDRIERAVPHGSPWFAARLRRMKCAVDV